MKSMQNISLFLLRTALGWYFFWAGITKVLNPTWSAGIYLRGAKTFTAFYVWLTNPHILPYINFLNEWGLTLIGLALMVGVCVRISAFAGMTLMILYYFPVLQFPYPNPYSFLVDEHIIYTFALFALASLKAGEAYGLERWCSNLPVFMKYPKLGKLLK